MKFSTTLPTFFAACLLASTAGAADITNPMTVDVALKNGKGEQVGTATLTELTKGVRITVDVSGLPPGAHGFHFHAGGKCVGPDFKSAGSHYSPTAKKHGFDAKGGHHAGDMKNIDVAADGTAKFEVVNETVSLKGPHSLTAGGGTSLIIHEKPDDYKSQPAGDAGGRLVCGEIAAPKK